MLHPKRTLRKGVVAVSAKSKRMRLACEEVARVERRSVLFGPRQGQASRVECTKM